MPKNAEEMQLLLQKIAFEELLRSELSKKELESQKLLFKIEDEETPVMDLPDLKSKHKKLDDEIKELQQKIPQFEVSAEDKAMANQFRTTIGMENSSFGSLLAVILRCTEQLKNALFALVTTEDTPKKNLSSLTEPERQALNTAKHEEAAACAMRGKLQEAAKSALGQFTFETGKTYALGKDNMSQDLAAILDKFTKNLQELQQEPPGKDNDPSETPQPGM